MTNATVDSQKARANAATWPPHRSRLETLLIVERRSYQWVAAYYGVSRPVVSRLAEKLGLQRETKRAKAAREAGATTKRTCLNCRKMFTSYGPGNRICGPCKGLEAYACGLAF